MSKRRVFSREFKLEAVKLVTEQGYGVGQAAESLGISANSLRKWREKFAEQGHEAFSGKGKLTATDEEMRKLREECRRLRMERDILKKLRQGKLGRRGFCPLGRMKLLIETLCGREPVRQSVTGSRKRVLRGVRVTGTAKRRQRVQKPCY